MEVKMNMLIDGSGLVCIALGASMISQGANVSFYASEKKPKKLGKRN
jgi:2-dehydropantoate 2-reductase